MIIPSKHSGYGEGGRLTSTRRVYDSGGGGTQTQITDLPDWAKPTAKGLLADAGTLTDINKNPYQQYTGQRTAQFTPLQQQAYGNAYNMDAGPQGFAQNIGTYMSPYQQNVIDREKMEAARTSQMLGQQQQAQATQAGAFGGYREGIQRAERERGLRSQMQDIQTRGSQAAFDRASDQFRSGITQQLAVGQQQAQFGGQQQGAIQNMLDTQYQDFLNQKKYPYQQLEFMSNILRGTPMGGTSSMYAPPGSMGGQLAGLGAGLAGLFRAEGGEVSSYAEGGVTDVNNIRNIIDKLSDQQLQEAQKAAAARGDQEQMQLIAAEMAQRASMRSGIASALPEEFAGSMEEGMATGGIVAFAGGGDIERYQSGGDTRAFSQFLREAGAMKAYINGTPTEKAALEGAFRAATQGPTPPPPPAPPAAAAPGPSAAPSAGRTLGLGASRLTGASVASIPVGIATGLTAAIENMRGQGYPVDTTAPEFQTEATPEQLAFDEDRRQSVLARRKEAEDRERLEFLKNASPEVAARLEKERAAKEAKAPARAPAPVAKAEEKPDKKEAPKANKEAPKANKEVRAAVKEVAASAGVPEKTLTEEAVALYNQMQGMRKPELDKLNALIAQQAGRAEEIKGRGLSDALMNFGFTMAAEASKPGAGFLSSASKAAPTITKTMAENQQAVTAAQDAFNKAQIEQLRSEITGSGENMRTSLTTAQNIMRDRLEQKKMAQEADYRNRYLAIQAAQAENKTPALAQIAAEVMADPSFKGTKLDAMRVASGLMNGTEIRTDFNRQKLLADKIEKDRSLMLFDLQLSTAKTDAERAAIQAKINERKATIARDLNLSLGGTSPAASGTGLSPAELSQVQSDISKYLNPGK